MLCQLVRQSICWPVYLLTFRHVYLLTWRFIIQRNVHVLLLICLPVSQSGYRPIGVLLWKTSQRKIFGTVGLSTSRHVNISSSGRLHVSLWLFMELYYDVIVPFRSHWSKYVTSVNVIRGYRCVSRFDLKYALVDEIHRTLRNFTFCGSTWRSQERSQEHVGDSQGFSSCFASHIVPDR